MQFATDRLLGRVLLQRWIQLLVGNGFRKRRRGFPWVDHARQRGWSTVGDALPRRFFGFTSGYQRERGSVHEKLCCFRHIWTDSQCLYYAAI